MNKRIKLLTLTAILAGLTLLLGLLPIGYIAIVPGFIEITILCMPAIIGSLVLGWRSGLALGIVFALTSVVTALTKSPLGALLFAYSPASTLVLLIAPRVLIPFTALAVYRSLRFKRDVVNIGIACAAGSLTNTILFLGLFAILFSGAQMQETVKNVITLAAFLNGSLEAAAAVIVCTPIIQRLKKVMEQ